MSGLSIQYRKFSFLLVDEKRRAFENVEVDSLC